MVVIVISGQPGCGSSTAAKLLAKKLGLKHFSVGDYNKSHKEGKEADNAIEMWKMRGLKKFHLDSDELARSWARKGNIVIDGKLQIRLARGCYDLSVWLKAGKKIRAGRYAERDKITMKDAGEKLGKKEKLEKENWMKIYGFNYFDQEKEADLVIDTGNKKPEEIVDIILKKLGANSL